MRRPIELTAPACDGNNLKQVDIVTTFDKKTKIILHFQLDLADTAECFGTLETPNAIVLAQEGVGAAVVESIFQHRKVREWFLDALQTKPVFKFWRTVMAGRRGIETDARRWVERLDVCMYPCDGKPNSLLRRERRLKLDHMIISTGMVVVVKPMPSPVEQALWVQKFEEPSILYRPNSPQFFEALGPVLSGGHPSRFQAE